MEYEDFLKQVNELLKNNTKKEELEDLLKKESINDFAKIETRVIDLVLDGKKNDARKIVTILKESLKKEIEDSFRVSKKPYTNFSEYRSRITEILILEKFILWY